MTALLSTNGRTRSPLLRKGFVLAEVFGRAIRATRRYEAASQSPARALRLAFEEING